MATAANPQVATKWRAWARMPRAPLVLSAAMSQEDQRWGIAGVFLTDDPRIEAAWLAGSLARGNADVHSDVDIHCLVADDSVDWFGKHWPMTAAAIMPLVLHGSIPGLIGGLAHSPGWQHLDLIFTSVGTFRPEQLAASHAAVRPVGSSLRS